MTLTIELTDDYGRTLVGEAVLWREELARRQSWVREVTGIRERGLNAIDLDIRTLVDGGRP